MRPVIPKPRGCCGLIWWMSGIACVLTRCSLTISNQVEDPMYKYIHIHWQGNNVSAIWLLYGWFYTIGVEWYEIKWYDILITSTPRAS